MKIAVLMYNISAIGGAERIAINLVNALLERNCCIKIYSLHNHLPSFSLSPSVEIESMGAKESFKWKDYFRLALKLRKKLKVEKYETVIALNTPLAAFSFLSTFCLPVNKIMWIHSSYDFDQPRWRLLSVLVHNKVVLLTRSDMELYRKKYLWAKKKLEVIYNFIQPISNEFSQLDTKRVIFVGRLSPEKGIDRLLSIWKNTNKSVDGWELVIVGDGPLRDELVKLVREMGLTNNVHLVGHKANVDAYLYDASIFAMTSRFEGLPMVLLEAQRAGLPVIAYDCPNGPREIITINTGFLVPDNNEKQYIEKLLALMSDIELRLSFQQNIASNLNRFDKQIIIDKWISILK